ncbi:MAG: hypothetical protein HOH43_13445 [Candidatus Latescibacteria bacterium]|jgi:hybrid cluster-associated redox disulfide protein|nr:hypothetical protein [Candidatus Latescibacterota bacterium]
MGIAEIIAAIALLIAGVGWLKVVKLQKAVVDSNEEMTSLRSHVTASANIVEQKIEEVRRTAAKRVTTGSSRFHADMTVAEVLDFHPDAASVMANFHLGGCSSCAISDHHVLGPACESYDIDTDALLAALNGLLEGGPIPATQPRGESLLQIDADV